MRPTACRFALCCATVLFVSLAKAETATYPPPAEVKASFLKLLDRPRVPADVQTVAPTKTAAGVVTESLTIATEKTPAGHVERVPMLIARADNAQGKLPTVIVLHGTGGTKEGMQTWLNDLAKQGFLAVAIDARYHGARAGGGRSSSAYNDAIITAWRTPDDKPREYPFFYDTCWDLWRTIDYLQTRDDVDANRIGMVGISMGGIETWLAAAVDERVRVAVPIIAVQSFVWTLDHDQWQGRARTIRAAHEAARTDLGEKELNARVCRELWSKIIPGILDRFDCPSMLRLFAGRPLLILGGEVDPNCPLGGAQVAIASAKAAFDAAGAGDQLKVEIAAGVGHTVTPAQRQMTQAWFNQWLKL